ncbi:hypothetical protein BSPLISOX_1090 [uncultured Gammaproteobacteria bacterium]|nr:hypothetical protein [uncultured Gammaproteobacteria bacterium]VVH67358.1 hypothetical protein BSPLISOX_1090 [uncultured Gammaproteobacteria bacterium]
MKKILYIFLTLLAMLALVITFFANPIGKYYAQSYAQKLLKTPVEISQLNLRLLDKSLNVDFIKVQNPPNFKNKNAFSLDHFLLKVGAIKSNLIVIDAIELDGLQFTLEQNINKVNLTQLLSNVEKQDENNISASAKTQDNNQQRIKIKTLEVRNISLKVNTKWIKTTLKIPNISAHNFGGNSGTPVNEIGKQVAQEILYNLKQALEEQGIEAGKKEIKASLRRKIEQKLGIEGSLDALENKTKDLFKGFRF